MPVVGGHRKAAPSLPPSPDLSLDARDESPLMGFDLPPWDGPAPHMLSPPPPSSSLASHLSPGPLTKRKKQPEGASRRLRGQAGPPELLDVSLRQYTNYDARGMLRSPLASPIFAPGMSYCESGGDRAFSKPDIRTTLERLEEDGSSLVDPLPILDLFSVKTFQAILKDQAAVARFRTFLGPDGRVDDLDFLLQVGEYNRAVSLLSQSVSNITLKHTGLAAQCPVRLPLDISKPLSTDMREVSGTVVPNLKSVLEDAGGYVEQHLARNVYPDFLKQQISRNLQVVNRGYSPNQSCPGFGEAFCITDPHKFDYPVVFASEGFANLNRYNMGELLFNNCRMLQGPRTRGSCTDRIRHGFLAGTGNEFIELVLNYRKDGTVYWNLLFMARLFGLDGELRYYLGGQIDVTAMLEGLEDVTHFMGTSPAVFGDAPLSPGQQQQQQHHHHHQQRQQNNGHAEDTESRTQSRIGPPGDEKAKYPPSVSRNRILQSFKWRQSSSQQQQPQSRPASAENNHSHAKPIHATSNSEPSTPVEPRRPGTTFSYSTGSSSSPSSSPPHTAVLSPCSRFMVLEHIPSAPSSSINTTESSFRSDGYKKKSSRPQLPLTFCSAPCLEMFGSGEHELADVIGMDIFEVLADMAGSSSITKNFKTAVYKSITEGEPVRLDVSMGPGLNSSSGAGGLVGSGGRSNNSSGFHRVKRSRGLSMTRRNHNNNNNSQHRRHFSPEPLPALASSFTGNSIRNSNGKMSGESAGGFGIDGTALRRSISADRAGPRSSHGAGSTGANYVSFWSPLKDDLGAIRWIVIILVPEVA
ncbi:hypothetical protein BD289DRAFT_450241 [Coniella lustricola]|uniref:PAC domain-containing protein n=1 Tax=Coniella lustricola TaxID=2025994 RepID=A0A2T3AJD9_9PEZI|nr:hypothetical protein BD289DRAFT_450241 [Coniella lustricola]